MARQISRRDDGRITMMIPARVRPEIVQQMRREAEARNCSLATVVGEVVERLEKSEARAV